MDSLNLKFCYLANTLLDSCTVQSLRFPFFFACFSPKTASCLILQEFMDNVCCDPSLSLCFPALHLPFILLLCGHQCRSFLIIPALASNISCCLFCTPFYPIPYSVFTPSFLAANFSSQYAHALGSVISKNLHSDTCLPPPFLPHLAFSLYL